MPEGGRRADAAEALAELEPLAARLPMEDPATAPPTEVARQTRVMVTSPTEGARASLDGGAPAKLPLIAPVETGKHKIVVSAPGFFDETREVQAADGALLALDLVLREKPATLEVRVETDAKISVDGRFIGVSPLDRPIELPAGTHVVAVMKNGRQGHSVDVKLERGKRHRLDVDLETTGQRVASTILFGTAGAALVTGGVFTVLALDKQGKAQDIRAKADEGNIARSDLVSYNDTLDRRDAYLGRSMLDPEVSNLEQLRCGDCQHVMDTYCMNPTCGCDEVAVQFFDCTRQSGSHKEPSLGHVKASVGSLRDPVINGQPILQHGNFGRSPPQGRALCDRDVSSLGELEGSSFLELHRVSMARRTR